MSSTRIDWLYFSDGDLPDPSGALVSMETENGRRLHVCASRAQVRALVRVHEMHAEALIFAEEAIAGSDLPETSDAPERVMDGWIAAFLFNQMTTDVEDEDVAAFCGKEEDYILVVPTDGDGTEALLSEFDATGNRLWVLPSKAAVRHKLMAMRRRGNDEEYHARLRALEASPLPEEDGEREMICLDGGLGAVIVGTIFCHYERRARAV